VKFAPLVLAVLIAASTRPVFADDWYDLATVASNGTIVTFRAVPSAQTQADAAAFVANSAAMGLSETTDPQPADATFVCEAKLGDDEELLVYGTPRRPVSDAGSELCLAAQDAGHTVVWP
jgi:hypothetical protein